MRKQAQMSVHESGTTLLQTLAVAIVAALLGSFVGSFFTWFI